MVQKPSLVAYFGNIEDVNTLRQAFEKDENFKPTGSLTVGLGETKDPKIRQVITLQISSKDNSKTQLKITEDELPKSINVSNFNPQMTEFIISVVESDGTTCVYASEKSAAKLLTGESKLLDSRNQPVPFSSINVIPQESMGIFQEIARQSIKKDH